MSIKMALAKEPRYLEFVLKQAWWVKALIFIFALALLAQNLMALIEFIYSLKNTDWIGNRAVYAWVQHPYFIPSWFMNIAPFLILALSTERVFQLRYILYCLSLAGILLPLTMFVIPLMGGLFLIALLFPLIEHYEFHFHQR